jgi:hypothetical protein
LMYMCNDCERVSACASDGMFDLHL